MKLLSRVLLVGFQDQDNLGLRYLASSLLAAGHEVRIESFGKDAAHLIDIVHQWGPDIIGFSMIFQFMAPDFKVVIKDLRKAGITAHLTMGGHYASFAPDTLIQMIPELDSIVRFEGELTLVELANAIAKDKPWKDTLGIAWHDSAGLHINPHREVPASLDDLPWPERRDMDYLAQSLPIASVLASRGCPWECSFCSIITFYQGNGTQGRRRRDPLQVVDEMEYLVRERGVRIILFQDDDFLAGGKPAREWALTIGRELISRGLHQRLRFKFSCRSDEVREDILTPLIEAGLTHVYLGVEAGDPDALKTLNKHITPEVHFRAGEVLRKLNITFDFGFMLMEPWSTITTVRNNLFFLRDFCSEGYTVAGFCRTLPYVGTPMEQRLRNEGRLHGPALEADYRFLDPRLDTFFEFSLLAFAGRNFGSDATWDRLRGLQFEARLDYPDYHFDPDFRKSVQTLTAASNELLFDITHQGLDLIERKNIRNTDDPRIIDLARFARHEDIRVKEILNALWNIRPRLIKSELFR